MAVLLLALLTLAPISVGAAGKRGGAPGVGSLGHLPIYRNRAYSPAERAADLVARMTLAEKASQMVSNAATPIRRLGIQAYGWWNEALHGVSRLQSDTDSGVTILNNTTSYPVDLSLGSSWDPDLMYREASAISDEAREVVPHNSLNLDFFAPTINLARDPRWGRNDESFSEDPLLTARMASQFVNGMEGKDERGRLLPQGGGYLKTVATLKHYAANNSEADRNTGSSYMDERTMREYYTAAFRMATQQSRPGAIMSAFNAVNGVPAAANDHLINTLARQTFGFGGYFTSDCDGIEGMVIYHHWRPAGWGRPANLTEAHALANAAGEDLNCGSRYDDPLTNANLLPAAAGEGIQTPLDTYNVEDMNTSLVRLFTARMQLGEFDNVNAEPWVRGARARLGYGSWVNSDANNAVTETSARLDLARQAADRSLVLLKNSTVTRADGTTGPTLPIQVPAGGPFRVAVIGYFANPGFMYLGSYSSGQGAPGVANESTPYAGIKQAIQAINPSAVVDYYSGFTGGSVASGLTTVDPAAVAAAATYDYVVVYAGTDASTSYEDNDRENLALPGGEAQLISQVAAVNPRTIAVMETVGEVNLQSFADPVPAMLWSSYNGQRKGDALADVLLGRYNPSGHLPFTWYQNEGQLPAITDYRIRPGAGTPGRTYMYFRGSVSFPFGYGLSYTTFKASNLKLDRRHLDANDSFHVTVDVTNTGTTAGEDLVQLYALTPGAPGSLNRPLRQLVGFRQVELAPAQTKAVTLTVRVRDMAFFNPAHGRYAVDDGRYWVQIADRAAPEGVQQQSFVDVRGSLDPVPSVVTANPALASDGSRGIQSRAMFPVGATVLPQLTVAMNDQSLYGYIRSGRSKPLPAEMAVRFTSDHPSVVAVENDGTIRTIHDGVATITATVLDNGVSSSTRFVVRVLSQLGELTVGSKSLPEFYPDTYSYDVIVPAGEHAPRVSATSADPRARVFMAQARKLPGAAHVYVTGPDGISSTYTVYFAHPALSDTFATSIGPQWKWIRRDSANEQLALGGLVIKPQQGDLAGGVNTARNILVQPAVGDWTIQSQLALSSPPHAETQQAGIIAYQDDDNYLKLDWEYSLGAARLSETTEDSLSGAPVTQWLATVKTAGRLGNKLWLRMVKSGSRYTTYYSADGRNFVRLYSVGASLTNVKVGLFAFGGADTTNDLAVLFGGFSIVNTGTVIGPPKPKPKPRRPPHHPSGGSGVAGPRPGSRRVGARAQAHSRPRLGCTRFVSPRCLRR